MKIKKTKYFKFWLLLGFLILSKPISNMSSAIQAIEQLAIEYEPHLDKAIDFLHAASLCLVASIQLNSPPTKIITENALANNALNEVYSINDLNKLKNCPVADNIVKAVDQTISMCEISQSHEQEIAFCPVPKEKKLISICPEPKAEILPKQCNLKMIKKNNSLQIVLPKIETSTALNVHLSNIFNPAKINFAMQYQIEDNIKENINRLKQTNFTSRFNITVRETNAIIPSNTIENYFNEILEAQALYEAIPLEIEKMVGFVNAGDFSSANFYTYSFCEIDLIKQFRQDLLKTYFTSDGFIKTCINDPLYTTLSPQVKKYLISNEEKLKTFNATLLNRYLAALKLTGKYITYSKIGDEITSAGQYFQEMAPLKTKEILYGLLDSIHDQKSQINTLLKLAENQSTPEYKSFFDSRGILRTFLDKIEIVQQYELILKSAMGFNISKIETHVIDKVNKLIYLETKLGNQVDFIKAKKYFLKSYDTLNMVAEKTNNCEIRLYQEISSYLINAHWQEINYKATIGNIPNVVTKFGRHLRNLQYIAKKLDVIQKNKNHYLDQARATILLNDSSVANIRAWPQFMQVEKELREKAGGYIDNILSCEVTLKNKAILSDALDEARKSCLAGSINDVKNHLNLCEKKLTEYNRLYNCNTKARTIDDILKDSKFVDQKTEATLYEKPGNYQEAVKDFDSLKPTILKDISNVERKGKVGILIDGRIVIVRSNSNDGRSTLEIQNPEKKKIKIRYGRKI